MAQLFQIVLFSSPTHRKLVVMREIPFLEPPFTEFVTVDTSFSQEAAEEAVAIWHKTEAIDHFQEIWKEANDPVFKGGKFSIMNALIHEQIDRLNEASRIADLVKKQHFSQARMSRRRKPA